jgi:hypothetical protein
MKKLVFVLIAVVTIGCGTKPKTETVLEKRPKLPVLVKCDEEASIYDQDSEYEFSNILKLIDVSYSTTYVIFNSQTDSLEKNDIRYKLAKLSDNVALKVFPDIKMTDASQLLAQDYKTLIRATSKFRARTKNPKYYKSIIVPTDKVGLQLFVSVSSSVRYEKTITNFYFFVFDTSHNSVVYYDYIKTECDPRDETMFMKTLYYGMNKLKNSIK